MRGFKTTDTWWNRISGDETEMNDSIRQIGEMKIIPVSILKTADMARPLAEALKAGGLPCLEITFRTAAAEEALKAAAAVPNMLIGAGTVLNTDLAKRAVDAGARFLVAPGFNPKLAEYCVSNGIPLIPGVATPTEIEAAMVFGLHILKFFPAEAFGGLKTLQAIAAPYPGVKFVPTGGITPANLPQYLETKCVLACGGTWIAKSDMVEAGRFDEITRITQDSVRVVRDMKTK